MTKIFQKGGVTGLGKGVKEDDLLASVAHWGTMKEPVGKDPAATRYADDNQAAKAPTAKAVEVADDHFDLSFYGEEYAPPAAAVESLASAQSRPSPQTAASSRSAALADRGLELASSSAMDDDLPDVAHWGLSDEEEE